MKKLIFFIIATLITIGIFILFVNQNFYQIYLDGEYDSVKNKVDYSFVNNTLKKLEYGTEYNLYQIIDDQFIEVSAIQQQVFTSNIIYLKAFKKANFQLDLEKNYGRLEKGEYCIVRYYRIVKNDSKQTLKFYFEILD